MATRADHVPSFIRHCVAKVGQKHGASGGFAICNWSAQKYGRMEPGSTKLTAKGRRSDLKHRSEDDAPEKDRTYKRLIAKAKKTKANAESTSTVSMLLDSVELDCQPISA